MIVKGKARDLTLFRNLEMRNLTLHYDVPDVFYLTSLEERR